MVTIVASFVWAVCLYFVVKRVNEVKGVYIDPCMISIGTFVFGLFFGLGLFMTQYFKGKNQNYVILGWLIAGFFFIYNILSMIASI